LATFSSLSCPHLRLLAHKISPPFLVLSSSSVNWCILQLRELFFHGSTSHQLLISRFGTPGFFFVVPLFPPPIGPFPVTKRLYFFPYFPGFPRLSMFWSMTYIPLLAQNPLCLMWPPFSVFFPPSAESVCSCMVIRRPMRPTAFQAPWSSF